MNPIVKAEKNLKSLRMAIDAHCYLCMGGEKSDKNTRKTVLKDVSTCKSVVCPLHSVRRVT